MMKKKDSDKTNAPDFFEELELDIDSDLPVREKQSKQEKKIRKVRQG